MRLSSRLSLSLSVALGLAGACDKGESDTRTATAAPATVPGSPPVPRLEGAIELPSATPAAAIAVFAVRVPSSMFASVIAADPMGIATDGMVDLKKDLDDFFGKTVGIQVLDATSITAFVLGKKDFGVVLTGVSGGIKATKIGEHKGVVLYGDSGGETLMAQQGDVLIVGTETAVKAGLDAAGDASKSAKGGELATFVAAQTDGATMAIAADLDKLPAELTREVPANVRADRGIIVFGADGLMLRAEGDKDKIAALAEIVNSGLAMAADLAEQQRKHALADPDDVAEGAAAIVGAHYMRSAKTMLAPKVEDGALTIRVPMKAGDPAILAAVAGIGAAIAIPAFTKYMRRAKSSEARVNLAKMFDATTVYFDEEHVPRGDAERLAAGAAAVDFAPHQCPNNGDASGQSGITPPLSVDCSKGPQGRCVPTAGGKGAPGSYDMALWADNDVWNGLNFQQEQGHYFHYNFIWSNEQTGYGTCQFTAQAFGDLDGDGVFSTYERSGASNEYGTNAAAGLYIDREVE